MQRFPILLLKLINTNIWVYLFTPYVIDNKHMVNLSQSVGMFCHVSHVIPLIFD